MIPKVTEVSRQVLANAGVDPAVGRFDNPVDENLAREIIQSMRNTRE